MMFPQNRIDIIQTENFIIEREDVEARYFFVTKNRMNPRFLYAIWK